MRLLTCFFRYRFSWLCVRSGRVGNQLEVRWSIQAGKSQQDAVGQPARWGGVIADVRNTEDKTVFEVVSFLCNVGDAR